MKIGKSLFPCRILSYNVYIWDLLIKIFWDFMSTKHASRVVIFIPLEHQIRLNCGHGIWNFPNPYLHLNAITVVTYIASDPGLFEVFGDVPQIILWYSICLGPAAWYHNYTKGYGVIISGNHLSSKHGKAAHILKDLGHFPYQSAH